MLLLGKGLRELQESERTCEVRGMVDSGRRPRVPADGASLVEMSGASALGTSSSEHAGTSCEAGNNESCYMDLEASLLSSGQANVYIPLTQQGASG